MTERSLTQTEAQRRAELLVVDRYEVDVDLTDLPTGPEVRCTSTITFTCREPGAGSFVDCAAEVVEATLNGTPVPPAVDGRIELTELAERNTLWVSSVQRDTSAGAGVHKAVDPSDGEVYLWTSFEPDEARYVWACFDQPDLKAPHTFTVVAPADWTVLSNSGDVQIEDVGRNARRWSFAPTPPLSTYNVVVNAGPFAAVRRTVGEYELGLFARRSLAAVLERDADEIFTVTAQGLEFYGRVFAMPFPQRTYNQVFVPEMGGAMENYGCVTWSDAMLRRVPQTPAEWQLFVVFLLHEMAHMWFGNLVTMRWWDDLWLNEAFAEFACHWSAVNATTYTDAWASHLASDEIEAYLADQSPISHPIRQPIHDVAQAASIFDLITYPKGASVLHQLMTYVGEENFSTGMADYFAEHQWGNTTLDDLMAALARASGRDLDAWRVAWLETAGTDRLELEHDGERSALVATAPSGPPRPHVLAVGAYAAHDGRLERVDTVRAEVTGSRTPLDLPPADFYLVNDDDLTFATWRPRPAERHRLFAAAAKLPTPLARGVAVATAIDLLANGAASAAEVVDALTAILAVETSDATVEPYLLRAWQVAERWAPDAQRPALFAAVAERSRELAGDPNRRTVALRTLVRVADLDELDRLRGQIQDDVDLQWRVLVRAAELGEATDAAAEELQARDPDPDSWVRALTVRAARADADAKSAAWRAVVDERQVPIGSSGDVMSAFWRPGQDDLLAPYAERYLQALGTLHAGGMIPANALTYQLFPLWGITADYPDRAASAAASAAPVVRDRVLERGDEVRRMLRARRAIGES